MSSTFRFNVPTGTAPDNTPRLLKKRKPRAVADPIPLGADANFFTDARGRWPIDSYADLAGHTWITLTRKESDLIALANPGVRPPRALECASPLATSAIPYERLRYKLLEFTLGYPRISPISSDAGSIL